MKVVFLKSLVNREEELADALVKGIETEGDECKILPISKLTKEPRHLGCDFVGFVGMKRHEWFDWCRDNNQRFMYFDKGYYHREFEDRKNIILWRVTVDAQQPTAYIETAKHTPDRWNELGRVMEQWRKPHPLGHIIVANSSEKYHEFHDLPHPTRWVEDVVAELRRYTDRDIWYRPKPSWRYATPVRGTKYCPREPLSQLFPGCHALVTYGSYICVDALLNGIPSIILGDGITRSISSTSISEIENPRLASDEERIQILANMAWCQYQLKEWKNGFAWRNIKELFV